MKSVFTLLLTVFIASIVGVGLTANSAKAASMKTEITSKLFENTKLVKSVVLKSDDKSEVQLSAVSHGLRKKVVFGLIPVKIYVLQFLAAKPEKLVKTEEGFLASLKDAGPVQLHLTFLRDLSGEKISNSFKDGLEVNGIDVKALPADLEQVLTYVTGISDFKKGQNFSITLNWSADKTIAYLTDPNLKMRTVTGSKDFADQLLSIWFGKTSDSKLEDLKKSLIL